LQPPRSTQPGLRRFVRLIPARAPTGQGVRAPSHPWSG
jgi:hypothetical protein